MAAEKGFKGFNCKGEFNIPAALFDKGGDPITGSFEFESADSSIESGRALFDMIMKLRETFAKENEREHKFQIDMMNARVKDKSEEVLSLKNKCGRASKLLSELEIITEGKYCRQIQSIRDVLDTNTSQNA